MRYTEVPERRGTRYTDALVRIGTGTQRHWYAEASRYAEERGTQRKVAHRDTWYTEASARRCTWY